MGRGWGHRGHLENTGSVILCASRGHTFEGFHRPGSAKATAASGGLPPSPQTMPFPSPRERQPSPGMLDNASVLLSMALLPHPFEMQCKPINSTLLLVAACMVCVLSIRKTVNPAHLFTLTSKGILHAHVSTGNY